MHWRFCSFTISSDVFREVFIAEPSHCARVRDPDHPFLRGVVFDETVSLLRCDIDDEKAIRGILEHFPVAPLAFPQGILRATPLGHVARHAEDTGDLAGLVAQRHEVVSKKRLPVGRSSASS